jgi:uncharacterized Zn-binding protein involved in type VI secretion
MAGLPAMRVGDFNIVGGVMFLGSFNTLINGRPFCRMGDLMTPHPSGHPKPPLHPPNPLVLGALKVLCNGRPAAKIIQTLETIQAPPHPWVGTGSLNTLVGG